MHPLPTELHRTLAARLGADGWLVDASERLAYGYDNSRRHAMPDAVALPRTRDDVVAIVQACLYCATAPKSNAAYMAHKAAWRTARETGSLMPPAHILNAPTKLMKDVGYGKGYAYDHDAEDGFSGADYWPEEIGRQTFYDPPERGFEREVRKRLDYWAKLRSERGGA